MRNCVISMIFFGLAGLASAESLPMVRSQQVEPCAGEMANIRGVWRSPQSFVPAYADWELLQYLTSLGYAHGVVVMPVYNAAPMYFRGNHIVFVSTGFLMQARSEQEVSEAIRTARVEVKTRDMAACVAVAPVVSAEFSEIQRRLAGQLAAYQDVTVRRLRIRDEVAR